MSLGKNYHTVYDGFYIFDLQENKWVPPAEIGDKTSSLNNGIRIGLAIGLSVLGAILCLTGIYCLYKKYGSILQDTIKRSIWHPR